MKSSLFLAAALALASTGSTFAANATHAVSDTTPAVTTLVPSKIVKPTRLPRTFTRTTVQVEFTLDALGQPQDIRMPSLSDKVLKRKLSEAFAQWQFPPATRQIGGRVTRFVLPLEIVPEV